MSQQNCEYWHIIENYLNTFLEMSNDPVIIINKHATIIYVNEAYEQQVGVNRDWVLGRCIDKKYPNDILLQVLRSGETILKKSYYSDTLGYTVVASFLPIRDRGGEVIAVAGIGNTSPVYKLNSRLSPV